MEEVGTSGTRPAPERIVGGAAAGRGGAGPGQGRGRHGQSGGGANRQVRRLPVRLPGDVSSGRGDAVAAAARRLDVHHVVAWSGAEFGENPRLRGEDLLRRFCAGEAFPDGAEELRRFVDDFPGGDRPEPGGHWTSRVRRRDADAEGNRAARDHDVPPVPFSAQVLDGLTRTFWRAGTWPPACRATTV